MEISSHGCASALLLSSTIDLQTERCVCKEIGSKFATFLFSFKISTDLVISSILSYRKYVVVSISQTLFLCFVSTKTCLQHELHHCSSSLEDYFTCYSVYLTNSQPPDFFLFSFPSHSPSQPS